MSCKKLYFQQVFKLSIPLHQIYLNILYIFKNNVSFYMPSLKIDFFSNINLNIFARCASYDYWPPYIVWERDGIRSTSCSHH